MIYMRICWLPFFHFFFNFSLTGKYVFHFNGNEITLDMTSTYTTYQQQQQQYISIFSQTICIIYFHNLHFTYVEYKVRVLSATIRLNLSSCNNSSFFFFGSKLLVDEWITRNDHGHDCWLSHSILIQSAASLCDDIQKDSRKKELP